MNRPNFDVFVAELKRQYPHLSPSVDNELIENVWKGLTQSSDGKIDSQSRHGPTKRKSRSRPGATNTQKRDAANLVAKVAKSQGEANKKRLDNPVRNVYRRTPPQKSPSAKFRASAPSNGSTADAFRITAEADIARLKKDGKLQYDYTLKGKYAEFNVPGIPDGSSLQKRDSSWWLPTIAAKYPGKLPFGGNNTAIWRNVMDYGAVGDGETDDTDAINAALNNGCGEGCGSTTTQGGVIYFPPGKWIASVELKHVLLKEAGILLAHPSSPITIRNSLAM